MTTAFVRRVWRCRQGRLRDVFFFHHCFSCLHSLSPSLSIYLSFFPSFFLYPPISSASCPFLLLAHRSLFALDDRYGDVIDAIGFWLAGFCWRPPTKSAAPPKTGKGANIFCSSLEWAILHNIDLSDTCFGVYQVFHNYFFILAIVIGSP